VRSMIIVCTSVKRTATRCNARYGGLAGEGDRGEPRCHFRMRCMPC
jgi:hypothetical protein